MGRVRIHYPQMGEEGVAVPIARILLQLGSSTAKTEYTIPLYEHSDGRYIGRFSHIVSGSNLSVLRAFLTVYGLSYSEAKLRIHEYDSTYKQTWVIVPDGDLSRANLRGGNLYICGLEITP